MSKQVSTIVRITLDSEYGFEELVGEGELIEYTEDKGLRKGMKVRPLRGIYYTQDGKKTKKVTFWNKILGRPGYYYFLESDIKEKIEKENLIFIDIDNGKSRKISQDEWEITKERDDYKAKFEFINGKFTAITRFLKTPDHWETPTFDKVINMLETAQKQLKTSELNQSPLQQLQEKKV